MQTTPRDQDPSHDGLSRQERSAQRRARLGLLAGAATIVLAGASVVTYVADTVGNSMVRTLEVQDRFARQGQDIARGTLDPAEVRTFDAASGRATLTVPEGSSFKQPEDQEPQAYPNDPGLHVQEQ